VKVQWILLTLAAAMLAGCNAPKVEPYKYKPPQMPQPSKHDELLKDLQERLKKCVEAVPAKIALRGALENEARISTKGEVVTEYAGSLPSTFESGIKRLVNAGCPDDMAEAHADGLPVTKHDGKSLVLVAEKVLLCGEFPDQGGNLIVLAKTLVMRDFKFMGSLLVGPGSAIISVDNLLLEGNSQMRALSLSGALVARNSMGLQLTVRTGVEGQGTLNMEAGAIACPAPAQ